MNRQLWKPDELEELGYTLRTAIETEPPVGRLCQWCGRDFVAKREDARFCSPACRVGNHRKGAKLTRACVACGAAFTTTRKNKRYCTAGCGQLYNLLKRK
jgi:predicted nucleic acid-binding Zn ribbon protein